MRLYVLCPKQPQSVLETVTFVHRFGVHVEHERDTNVVFEGANTIPRASVGSYLIIETIRYLYLLKWFQNGTFSQA